MLLFLRIFFPLFILENTRNLLPPKKTHAERGGKKGEKEKTKPTTSSQRAHSISLLRQHLLPSLLHPQGEGVERFTLHQAVSNAAGGSRRAQGRPLTPHAAPSPRGGPCRPPPASPLPLQVQVQCKKFAAVTDTAIIAGRLQVGSWLHPAAILQPTAAPPASGIAWC